MSSAPVVSTVAMTLVGYTSATFGSAQQAAFITWATSTLSLTAGTNVTVSNVVDVSTSAAAAGRRRLLSSSVVVTLAFSAPAGSADAVKVTGASAQLGAAVAAGSPSLAALQALLSQLTSASLVAPPTSVATSSSGKNTTRTIALAVGIGGGGLVLLLAVGVAVHISRRSAAVKPQT